MTFRFCDDLGPDGFGWMVEEAATRTSHALAARFGVPHVVAPGQIPGTPFAFVDVMLRKHWRESALWWAQTRTLVVAEVLGTNRFFTGGMAPIGVHVVLRLTPPKALAAFEPERVLVGHGEGIVGPDGTRQALAAGVNDLGGTLMNESISRSAGAAFGQEMPPERMEELICSAGRVPRQRTTLYGDVPEERVRASFDAAPLAEPSNPPVKDAGLVAPPRLVRPGLLAAAGQR